ncbi:MAG: type II toxin-antitoxin system RelE/ParE family toxin [Chitinophagaceae bacterium]|nr:type II toxin-antitoxin system RelE/ParE family toxin [Chitinophagaceae bacterium]
MAYKIVLQKKFIVKSAQVAQWIEKKWSKASADKFVNDLYGKIESLRQTPLAGMASLRKAAYRKLIISRHNKVYYRVKGKTIYRRFI